MSVDCGCGALVFVQAAKVQNKSMLDRDSKKLFVVALSCQYLLDLTPGACISLVLPQECWNGGSAMICLESITRI
jgi:hypothetical protein